MSRRRRSSERQVVPELEGRLRWLEAMWEIQEIYYGRIQRLPEPQRSQILRSIRPEFGTDWRQYRAALLNVYGDLHRPYDMLRFSGVRTFCDASFSDEGGESVTTSVVDAFALHEWTRWSRRVYEVSSDLQAVLMGAQFDPDMQLGDLDLPFRAFAIRLAEPLTLRIKDRSGPVSLLLVFLVPDEISGQGLQLSVVGIGESFAGWQPPTKRDIDICRAELERNVMTAYNRITDQLEAPLHGGYVSFREQFSDVASVIGLLDRAGAAAEDAYRDAVPMYKIVLGLCLQLSTKDPPVGGWPDAPRVRPRRRGAPGRIGRHRSISDGAQVCEVRYHNTARLSGEARDQLRRAAGGERVAGFQPPMWIAGYRRRRPGRGNDPRAPKDVRVGAYLRGAELLEAGQLPGGTSTKVRR